MSHLQTKMSFPYSPTSRINFEHLNIKQKVNNVLSTDFIMLSEQENAQKIAEFLSSHPRVKRVNYAGLPGHPGRALHYSQVLDPI